MIVQCFTLNMLRVTNTCFRRKNCKDINIVYKEFGANIPKYLQYEGGQGRTFLFCVDASVNVINICRKYNYLVDDEDVHIMEIDDDTYNNSYTIYPTYDNDSPFILHHNQRIRQQASLCALRARAKRAHNDLAQEDGAAERSAVSHDDERSGVKSS